MKDQKRFLNNLYIGEDLKIKGFLRNNSYQYLTHSLSEKETQKGKYKNPQVQICERCERVKSNNRIIQKSISSNMQKM